MLNSLWYDGRGQGLNSIPTNGLSFFPLGQIEVFDGRPVDNQADRTTIMWNPFPDWLPGSANVEAPYIGNKLYPVTPIGWLPTPVDVGATLG